MSCKSHSSSPLDVCTLQHHIVPEAKLSCLGTIKCSQIESYEFGIMCESFQRTRVLEMIGIIDGVDYQLDKTSSVFVSDEVRVAEPS